MAYCYDGLFFCRFVTIFYLYIGDLDGQIIFDHTKATNHIIIVSMLIN